MSATSALSRDECRKIVQKQLQRDDFELMSFTMSPLSSEMKGLMGDHLKLLVSVLLGDKENRDTEGTELQFFIKAVPVDDDYRRKFAVSGVTYQKEVLFYSDLQRDVQKHLRCSDYESSTYLGTVPQCYYLRPDLLVLEDLALAGFGVLDSKEPLDLEHCKCVLKAVARFHAASLVYEECEGQRLADAHPLLLEESFYRKERGFSHYDAQAESRRVTHVLLDLIPRFAPGTAHSEELHRFVNPVMEDVYELLKPSGKYRNVLCHRDLWLNNMLFAKDAKGELSVLLVDFQTLHLEPPAHDVLLFLHLNTTRELRQTHGRKLLELYHQTLAEVLRQHDLNVDSVLPLQIFLQSCDDSKPVAVIVTIYILQALLLPLQQDADLESFLLDRRALAKAAYEGDERYRSRMTEAMEELVETCLLPRLREHQR
ncbi:uncharacterized protein LOC124594043 [Schistocerca americana]|uniref:uncharacterized protein LOC124594043 n=1 Tax=Schistocerca americana TaxID=7009 RepID=UPI001F4F6A24|nr:uncharacterized protein LOC124594043 [Schistocerca americana]